MENISNLRELIYSSDLMDRIEMILREDPSNRVEMVKLISSALSDAVIEIAYVIACEIECKEAGYEPDDTFDEYDFDPYAGCYEYDCCEYQYDGGDW